MPDEPRQARFRPRNAVRVVVALLCLASAVPASAAVTSEQVAAAVRKGVTRLRRSQRADGRFVYGSYPGGMTALCVLAMLNAGVGADDPAVQDGLAAVGRAPDRQTYVVALKCQVYAAADPDKYARELSAAAKWLVDAQLADGGWTYTDTDGKGSADNSNTQFALLGLHEAAKAGVHVPELTWAKARGHFRETQTRDGGWGYRGENRAYGSMTTAGVASLYICGQRLNIGGPKVFRNGVYPSCGNYRQSRTLAAGLNWIGRNFTVRENPKRAGNQWVHYYLYGLERVGMIAGRATFGGHDWYREGAARLIDTQEPDGSWGRGVYDTAFAILFLAKGNRPVLIQKVQWDGEWNRNLHDLENLTAFIGDKLGKPPAWRTTPLSVPASELHASPILFITGHEFPAFTDAEKDTLRRYVETGGTLLAEACCGQEAFAGGFREFAAEVFSDYPLHELPRDHAVFSSYYDLTGDAEAELSGIDVGCRTAVFFSPRALSALWELRTIPEHSERALRIGTNVAAYATGRELRGGRLDAPILPERRETAVPVEIPRGAVRIARIIHDGDYRADPHALGNLAEMLREEADVDVVAQERHVRADDEAIFQYPVLFMTGHHEFEMSEGGIRNLRLYLERGGVLLADACCGRKEFDRSFRELADAVLPERKLEPLPADHVLFTGEVGRALGELRCRKVLADELGHEAIRPPIEAAIIDGRAAILYSTYDWSCGLEGDKPYSCRGYVDADARKLAMNLLLYAIGY